MVIPVHGRPHRTRVCLEQKLHLVDELAGHGIDAQVLVVGQDESVETARELGFHTMERRNVLPLKLNDAFEWCIREAGADYVSFVGSDDFMAPEFMADLPAPDRVRVSKWIAFVSPAGDQLLALDIPGAPGNAPWIVPAGLLEPCGYRPFMPETKRSGMDGLLRQSLLPAAPANRHERRRWYAERGGKERAHFEHRDDDMLRAVDFKGHGEQMTPYASPLGRRSRIRLNSDEPWAVLATRYPADLVGRMQAVYANGQS